MKRRLTSIVRHGSNYARVHPRGLQLRSNNTAKTTDSSASCNKEGLIEVLNPIRPGSEQINEQNFHTLNPFLSNIPFWFPWKYQRTKGFLMFSGLPKGNNREKRVFYRKKIWNALNLMIIISIIITFIIRMIYIPKLKTLNKAHFVSEVGLISGK